MTCLSRLRAESVNQCRRRRSAYDGDTKPSRGSNLHKKMLQTIHGLANRSGSTQTQSGV